MSRTYRKPKRIKLSDGTFREIGKRNSLTRHHLIPKERRKLNTIPEDEQTRNFNRVLMLWRDKHNAWHHLFHNLTLGEIIKVLQRVEQIIYKSS